VRILMKIRVPDDSGSALRQDSDFDAKWKTLLAGLGALSVHSNAMPDGRFDYAVFDIKDLAALSDLAKTVHGRLGVKVEFLPEVVPKSYFGQK
jgi:hypothetical protein